MPTNTDTKILYPELSYTVVGCCFNAHNELGRYAREKQYADHLEKQFNDNGILFTREQSIGDGGNIIDFLVADKIVLELKATRRLTQENFRQIQNYLQQSQMKLGLLINFREEHLKPRRVICIDNS